MDKNVLRRARERVRKTISDTKIQTLRRSLLLHQKITPTRTITKYNIDKPLPPYVLIDQ